MNINILSMRIPEFNELAKIIEGARDLGVEVVELGITEEGRPVYGMYFGRGKARLAIVSSQHGSEPAPALASIIFTYRALRNELRIKRSELLAKYRIMVVPIANPDGLSKLRKCLEECKAPDWRCECVEARFTSLLEDPNRDWLLLKNKPIQAIHKAINEFDPHIVLDLHEFYAKGGAPPKWAHETEGFDAYVTDTPYLGVSPEIMTLSAELALRVRNAIESSSGWKTRILRPGNGVAAYPPIYLGTHAPFEGCAKLLVETWGVGLGNYLLYERVSIHLEAIITALDLMNDIEFLEYVKRMDKKYDEMIGREASAKYIVKGEDLDKAKELLSKHKIKYKLAGSELCVELPQRYSRITLFLLDKDYYVNKILARKGSLVTIDKFLNVDIIKKKS